MAKKASSDAIEVVFSWDTTGSMYPCLSRVQDEIQDTVTRLFKDVPNLRVGCIAHGDYCDAGSSYVIKTLDLTDDPKKVISFIKNVGRTGGGDSPECYELVLHTVRSFSWTAGKNKIVTMIGDDVPHSPKESQNTKKLDWRNELDMLLEGGVKVYGVQCLDRGHATPFWKEVAEKTGGFHLKLAQFDHVRDLIMAVCYKQAGDEQLQNFEKEVAKNGRMNRAMDAIFGVMLGRKAPTKDFGKVDLEAVPPWRFQMMNLKKDQSIKDFVEKNGLEFETGRGFYEFTKSVKVQKNKEVILVDKKTGDMYTGHKARKILNLPDGSEARIKPPRTITEDHPMNNYRAFIQSNSYNRKLLKNTAFLYEVNLAR